MSYLLIDIGNTKAKFCLAKDETYAELTYQQAMDSFSEIKGVALASVASDTDTKNLIDTAKKLSIPISEAKVESNAFGVTCGYPEYNNLGIDRWLAVLAAEKLFPNENLVVVDAGTALTVDFLSSSKKHLGGWIIPGLDLMQSSIVAKAPGVFAEEEKTRENFGSDTPSAVFNGCFYACVASIERAVKLLQNKSGEEVRLVLTGGNSLQLAQELSTPYSYEQFLVFAGLKRFLDDEN